MEDRGNAAELVIILEDVANPHNVGAILRSAANFGCRFVLLPGEKNFKPSAALLRTAEGGGEMVEFVSAPSINVIATELRQRGLTVLGTALKGRINLYGQGDTGKLPSRLAVILGNESRGLSQEAKKSAAGMITIPGTESARERAINTAGKAATERQKVETSKPEYVEKQTQDWRMLPQLVRTGKMKKEDAHKKLKEWETLHGTNDDIATARKALDASQEPEAEKPWYDPRSWFGESTENYYYNRLANLFEETSDQPISGVNPAAYGYTPKGQRKARLAAKGFAEPMKSWAGDSTVEAPDLEPESTERPHIDTVVAPHIETLVRAAAQNEIDLSHGEAFDPRSKDHQRLIIKTKDPEVMKASEAIRQIRKDYGMED
jgi:tRNA(Leu) C34 or U34 (ribose-2'-O)-methylase TrmL